MAPEDLIWRPPLAADISALLCFEADCADVDGATDRSALTAWEPRLRSSEPLPAGEFGEVLPVRGPDGARGEGLLVEVTGPAGTRIAAAGWVELDEKGPESRVYLDGRVHPAFRGCGIGSELLRAMESHGRRWLAALPGGRSQVLRILFYDRAPDAQALFEQNAFVFRHAEDDMEVKLGGCQRADAGLPSPKLAPEHWSSTIAADFFRIYDDAFGTRPGSSLTGADWHRAFANPRDEDFRPQLSLLVREGAEPIAYTVCHEQPEEDGSQRWLWITQTGVKPGWRRQGIGRALLAENLRRAAASGYSRAMLSVNVDNPEARALYEELGFRMMRRCTVYSKDI